MRGIKPFKLGFLTRPFQWGSDHHLGIAVLAYFPLDAEPTLLTDMEMWTEVPEVLGANLTLDLGIPKSRSEFLVSGSAYQEDGVAGPLRQVRVKVGALEKQLYVIGNRYWEDGVPTPPEPFVALPLSWANAFGGEGYERNPLGKGYKPITGEDGKSSYPLPNIETPHRMIDSMGDKPEPAGFGPIDFTWPQRFSMSGTYDKAWLETRFPGFAEDLDWRIWNMAAPDQHQDEAFVGDEDILCEHLHPEKPRLEGKLPGILARAFVDRRTAEGNVFAEVPLKLTTIWLLPEIERGIMVFHGACPVTTDDADDVDHLIVAGERMGAPQRPLSHYEEVLARRIGPDMIFEALNDSDLMPADLADLGKQVQEQTKLTTLEQLRYKRQRAVADQKIEDARERLRGMGLDPDEHGPVPLGEAEPIPASLEEVGKLAKKMLAQSEAMKAEAEVREAAQLDNLRAFCAKMGLDYEEMVAETKETHRGPPTFTAAGKRNEMRKLADYAAAAGHPVDELEFLATDDTHFNRWKEAENALGEVYRMSAHRQSPAFALSADDSRERRAAFELALREGRSVAWWDMTGTDLREIDLSGVDLTRAYLESADLSGARLDGANLGSVVLASAKLEGASLKGANLAGANLGGASFVDANLTGANLSEATMTGVALRGANLSGVSLRETNFAECDLSGACFTGADLSHATFRDMSLEDIDFRGVDLTMALFFEATATGLDFSGATLVDTTFVKASADGARFVNADMTGFRALESSFIGADFKGARLDRASMRGAKMMKADLAGAHLNEADLSKADLTEANLYRIVARQSMWMRTCFRKAMMVSADLFEALLSKADIRGADLRGANLYGSDFSLVWSDADTNVEESIQDRIRVLPLRPQT